MRVFHPTENVTAVYDWPAVDLSHPDRLWFNGVDFIRVDTVTAGGVTIPPTDYVLEPANWGPPYTWLQIKDASTVGSLSNNGERWQTITVTGTTGYTETTVTAGVINNVLTDDQTVTGLDVDISVGVGSLLKLGDEWVTVKDRYWSKTTDTLAADVDKSTASDQITISSVGEYCPGETIRIDAEKMLVESYDAESGIMTVRRAFHGSTLAAHTAGVEIETQGTYKLERGQLGTTAVAHAGDTPVKVWQPPALIRELCIAEAITTVQQGAVGYRPSEGGGGAYVPKGETRGAGLDTIRSKAISKYRRTPIFRPI